MTPFSLPFATLFGNAEGMLIIGMLVLLLFGGQKIPELMRGLGKGMGELKKGMEEGRQHFEQAIHMEPDKPAEAVATPEVKPVVEALPRQAPEQTENAAPTPEPHS
jgi:sec-independent protein translocase protein TatA